MLFSLPNISREIPVARLTPLTRYARASSRAAPLSPSAFFASKTDSMLPLVTQRDDVSQPEVGDGGSFLRIRIEHRVAGVARLGQLFHRRIRAAFVASVDLRGHVRGGGAEVFGEGVPFGRLAGLLRIGDIELGVLGDEGHH